jgi:hypothetical protein
MTEHSLSDSADGTARLVADVVTYRDAPDECTLSPANAAEGAQTTAWLTARGDAFVTLDSMR